MFERKDCPTIMSGLVVRYQSTNDRWDYEISASRDGVCIQGRWPTMSVESTVIAEEYLTRARWHHRHLKRQYELHHALKVQALTEQEVIDIITRNVPTWEITDREDEEEVM